MPSTSSRSSSESRRTPPAASPVLFTGGFRPFFLAGALWVPLALLAWVLMLAGWLEIPSNFDPLAWHQHELLFGYASAIVAGFVLTAVPNWTGRPPLQGLPLALLAGVWVAGRLAVATSAVIGAVPAMVIDSAFLAALTALVLREVLAGKNARNLPVVLLLAAFAMANLISHLAPLGLAPGLPSGFGHRLAIAVLTILIGLIGGRVVPNFTRNWLAKRGPGRLPAAFGRYDQVALIALVVALLSWTVVPDHEIAGPLLIVAGGLHLLRVARWAGWRTAREPLVLVLHVGYAWLPIGLVLLGLEQMDPGPWPFAALHALTVGAIGIMPLAIMTRATLGHTGRKLHAGPATVAIYGFAFVGALLRVASPALPFDPLGSLGVAAFVWASAFALFVLIYGPMLVQRPRQDPA